MYVEESIIPAQPGISLSHVCALPHEALKTQRAYTVGFLPTDGSDMIFHTMQRGIPGVDCLWPDFTIKRVLFCCYCGHDLTAEAVLALDLAGLKLKEPA